MFCVVFVIEKIQSIDINCYYNPMKKIPLTKNLYALIDDEDYDLVKSYPWHAGQSRDRYYARAFIKCNPGKRESVLLQHLVFGKAPSGKRLSFKDNNSLNCQKDNLEFISRSQAAHDYYKKVRPNKNNTEKFKGVSAVYSAYIKHQNKVYRLGSFSSELEAAKAYNLKAIEFYGDRAKINEV